MKFDRKKIVQILATHQTNIDKRAINMMFSSVRLLSDARCLKISSMDGERFLEDTIQTQFEKFDIFLPGLNFYEILRKSNSEIFEIIENETSYLVRIGSAEFKFTKYSGKGYPEWVDSYAHSIEIDSKELLNALKLVKWAASNDDARPFLNGVCFDIQEEINICATDGLRLALKRLPNQTSVRDTFIMGRKSINDLIKLLEDAQGNILFSFGKNAHVKMNTEFGEVNWKTLLIAGKFPQYSKIIPTSSVAKLQIDCKDLTEVIERMMIIANANQPVLTFMLDKKCELIAENALSSGKDEIAGEYDGAAMKISFNGRLLLEMLNNLSGKLVFEINNPHSPMLIKQQGEDAIFILAPVKRD